MTPKRSVQKPGQSSPKKIDSVPPIDPRSIEAESITKLAASMVELAIEDLETFGRALVRNRVKNLKDFYKVRGGKVNNDRVPLVSAQRDALSAWRWLTGGHGDAWRDELFAWLDCDMKKVQDIIRSKYGGLTIFIHA